MKAAIFTNGVPWFPGDIVDYVYGEERLRRIAGLFDLYPTVITSENFAVHAANLRDVEAIFSCWGVFAPGAEEFDQMPRLRGLFHAGGSVRAVAEPFIRRGVAVCTAVEANAIPVAEFCLGQILLSCKGAYRNSQYCRQGSWAGEHPPIGRGAYGETVALIGIGAVSRHLLKLLRHFDLRVIAVCEYLTPAQARDIGIDALVDIDTAFREGYVVSNQLADTPANARILQERHFASLREGATFINTGRGAQVDEPGMLAVLRRRPDLTALLDVQAVEPPEPGSELYTLPNVFITSHIAGSANDEVRRMADYVIRDAEHLLRGEPMPGQVDPAVLLSRA